MLLATWAQAVAWCQAAGQRQPSSERGCPSRNVWPDQKSAVFVGIVLAEQRGACEVQSGSAWRHAAAETAALRSVWCPILSFGIRVRHTLWRQN